MTNVGSEVIPWLRREESVSFEVGTDPSADRTMLADASPELSPRARRLLESWERRPAVPTEEVEARFAESGCPCFAPWLAFHERYAGYVERFGHDGFVLGIVHRNPYWWTADKPCCEQDGPVWSVWCADGHPTYTYQLDQEGEFAAHGQHRSFDLYVERLAALREFAPARKAVRDLSAVELRGAEFMATFDDRIRPGLVEELSDQFWRYYVTDTHFVIGSVESGTLSRAWVRPVQV
jgi:hypothetical protein